MFEIRIFCRKKQDSLTDMENVFFVKGFHSFEDCKSFFDEISVKSSKRMEIWANNNFILDNTERG